MLFRSTLDNSAAVVFSVSPVSPLLANIPSNALKDNSVEAVKLALTQTTLNEKQIEGILANKGLTGETLKTTAAELSSVTSTNAVAVSQGAATTTTIGFKNAITGLGISLKKLVLAHPYLLAIAGSLAAIKLGIWGMNKFQDWTNGTSDINKYNKALEDSEQKVSDNNSQMEEYQNELSQNKDKLEELQKLQNNGTITEAQKTEIDNLKYQNALLEEKLQKLKDINEQETKNQAHDAADRFNTEFNEGNDKNQSTNANDVIERVKKTYSNTSPDGESTGINFSFLSFCNSSVILKFL